jgi:predicted nucleic acid-binding protein
VPKKGEKVFVDTNIFLRFLTGDDPARAERCRAFFERADRGEMELHISDLTLAELAWTLRSYYARPREEIAAILAQVLDMRSVRVSRKGVLRDAVAMYGQQNVDFIDAYHAAEMRRRELRRIYSYDEDFDRLGIKREEP